MPELQQPTISRPTIVTSSRGIRYRIVACETCLDRQRISRIRGGQTWPEPCPDCGGGTW